MNSKEKTKRFFAVALSGSLPARCGLVEPVIRDEKHDAFFFAAGRGSLSAMRTREELEALAEEELVTLLDSTVPINRDDLGVHLSPAFREALSSKRLDHFLRTFPASSQVGAEGSVYFGQRRELIALLTEISADLLREFDYEMAKSVADGSESLDKLFHLANLGIASAQHDLALRWEHLVGYGTLLRIAKAPERLTELRKYSVERVAAYSAEEFDKSVEQKLQEFVRSLDQTRKPNKSVETRVLSDETGQNWWLSRPRAPEDFAMPA